jgi:hypothetical protein
LIIPHGEICSTWKYIKVEKESLVKLISHVSLADHGSNKTRSTWKPHHEQVIEEEPGKLLLPAVVKIHRCGKPNLRRNISMFGRLETNPGSGISCMAAGGSTSIVESG